MRTYQAGSLESKDFSSLATYSTVEDLIDEIKNNFGSQIYARDYNKYEAIYRYMCGPTPENILSRMSLINYWAMGKSREFRRITTDAGVEIVTNPPVYLHDYKLEKIGLERLKELKDLIMDK